VNETSHSYLTDLERREEGGTPGIIESIRAGLVFKLQQDVGTEVVEAREKAIIGKVMDRWETHPNIHILGNLKADRLSIVSFQVLQEKMPLHYGLVVALLNDVFGIQARGGCSCAGPYGHRLLQITAESSAKLDSAITAGAMILRPGWVRLNFNYFVSDEHLNYILTAIELIADHGWKRMGDYRFNRDSGAFEHKHGLSRLPVSLYEFSVDDQYQTIPQHSGPLNCYLNEAKQILSAKPGVSWTSDLSAEEESMRWFYLPEPEHHTCQ